MFANYLELRSFLVHRCGAFSIKLQLYNLFGKYDSKFYTTLKLRYVLARSSYVGKLRHHYVVLCWLVTLRYSVLHKHYVISGSQG